MRQIKFFAILIAAVATIFSCQKQDELSIDGEVQTLRAYAPGSGNADEAADTKVGLTEAASGSIELDWQVDDVITIYDSSSDRVGNWKVQSVAADGKASFVKVDGENLAVGVDYTAVYPASTAATLSDRSGETIATSTQTADDNMEHLDDNLRMSSSSFQIGSTISFAHEVAIMSVTFESSEVPTVAKIVMQGESYTTNLSGFSAGVSTAHFILPPSSGNRVVEFTVNDKAENKVIKPTTAPFKAGKRYTWNAAGLMLADISADNIPSGDTWTIVDVDATAGSSAEFDGLQAALIALDASRTVNLVFPNLTTVPSQALYNIAANATCTFSAPKVTSVGALALGSWTNLTTVSLPKATTLSIAPFYQSNDITKLTLATIGRVVSTHKQSLADVTLSSIDLITHPSNANGAMFKLADGTEVGPFKSINGVAAGLMLAYIDADNIPEGDTWTIEDTDATAGSEAKFAGLKAALIALDASRTVNLVFPNLTTLTSNALNNCQATAKWTFSAPNMTTIQHASFAYCTNLTTISLPKVTTLGVAVFFDSYEVTKLTIAKEERVIETLENETFTDAPIENIDLITHPSNANGAMFKLADGTEVGPFKSINGVTPPPAFEVLGADENGYLYAPNGKEIEVKYKVTPANTDISLLTFEENVSGMDVSLRVEDGKIYIKDNRLTESRITFSWNVKAGSTEIGQIALCCNTRLGFAYSYDDDSFTRYVNSDVARFNWNDTDDVYMRAYWADNWDDANAIFGAGLDLYYGDCTIPNDEYTITTSDPAITAELHSDGETIILHRSDPNLHKVVEVTFKQGGATFVQSIRVIGVI